MEFEKLTDKTIDFLFEKKELVYLFLIVLLGAILRAIVANNVMTVADEMVHGPQSIGFLAANKISHMTESISWRCLNDIIFNIAGFTMFTARFLSFFFGTLTIIVVYLLGKLIYNKKVGLIAAFLLSISVYTIRYTLIEMDETMMFFVLFGIYLFAKKLKEKNQLSLLSAVFLGLSIPIKTIGSFFIVALFIYMLVYLAINKNLKEFVNKNKKDIIVFALILLFFTSPILISNYLLYKDKGIVDVYFAGYFNISREIYNWQLGYDHEFTPIDVIVRTYDSIKGNFFGYDFIITLFSLIGVIIAFFKFKDKKKWTWLLLSCLIIAMGILSGINYLPTHYVSFVAILVIFAALTIEFISEKLKNLIKPKKSIILILVIITIVNIITLWPYLSSETAMTGLRDYAINNIEPNSIVIVDGRLYRGRMVFAFWDRYYMESSFTNQIIQAANSQQGPNIPIKTYFIECIPDDCGWGNIKNQPEFNQSMEQMIGFFKNISIVRKEISAGGGDYELEAGKPYFRIYETTITSKPQVYQIINSTHSWFMYPVNYQPKEQIYDNYTTHNLPDKFLDLIGHLALYIAVILSILSPIYLIYLLIKEENIK